MQESEVQSLGQEDPLEKRMATRSSILAWRILWTEEPGGLQSVVLQEVRHDWAINTIDDLQCCVNFCCMAYWLSYVHIYILFLIFFFSSVQFSHSVVSDSLRPHGLQHARPLCPSPTPGVYTDSYPLSRWCHPTISSSPSLLSRPLLLPPSIFPNIRDYIMVYPRRLDIVSCAMQSGLVVYPSYI